MFKVNLGFAVSGCRRGPWKQRNPIKGMPQRAMFKVNLGFAVSGCRRGPWRFERLPQRAMLTYVRDFVLPQRAMKNFSEFG